jgi:hypothetical protein
MYLKYEACDFHRPINLICSFMVNGVAILILKEWDLKFASAKPSTAKDFFN